MGLMGADYRGWVNTGSRIGDLRIQIDHAAAHRVAHFEAAMVDWAQEYDYLTNTRS
jgi:hypothetical protein